MNEGGVDRIQMRISSFIFGPCRQENGSFTFNEKEIEKNEA